MRRSFYLNHKPFSINAYWYGDRRHKTAAARDWESQIFFQMDKENVRKALGELRNSFDKSKHVYGLKLTAYYPAKIFYTSANVVSAKTFDITNWEKPLVDLLFLPKHHITPFPNGAENLNMDDKHLVRLTSQKVAWDRDYHSIKVDIYIISGLYD